MTTPQDIGCMMGVGFDGLTPPDYLIDWLKAGRVGAVVLFARNVASPAQVADLTAALHAASPSQLLIAIDQEGGRVARLRAHQGFTESPGAMALGAADSEALAERVAAAMAAELHALGINWVLAPVADIVHYPENPVIGTRALGSNPERVAALVAAQSRGFQSQGVAAAVKHFPGHGNTRVDSHVALPLVASTPDELQRDLMPFRAAIQAGVASVMVSHLMIPALDSEQPATLSPAAIDGLLRRDLGYDGLVCTDCMEMRAIRDSYGAGESAALTAIAGSDLIFFSHTRAFQEQAFEAVYQAAQSERLSPQRVADSARRVRQVASAYAINQPPESPIDVNPAVMLEAARAGTVLLRADAGILPVQPGAALIEFASYLDTGAMERGQPSNLAALAAEYLPGVLVVSIPSDAPPPDLLARLPQIAAEARPLILATRNAHLYPETLELARSLIAQADNVALVCLANPYDAAALDAPNVHAVVCTCGDAQPSLRAALETLSGRCIPTGRLPVVFP